ncbi:MAG: diguanylate cyclase [Sphingomonadaceae bacterium]|nr:diguanylate cyclase [Sphingomonadaceae bacterium]
MRIATITNWAYGITVALTLVSGGAMLLASQAEEQERAAVAQRERLDHLTETVVVDAFRLSDQARLYAIDGDPAHLVIYRREAADEDKAEAQIARLGDAGARPAELDLLRQGLHDAAQLRDEQAAAIAAAQAGRRDEARRIMFGPQYERDVDRIVATITRFQGMLDQRSDADVALATAATQRLRTVAEILVGATALLFLFVLVFVIRQRILHPVVRLSDVVTRLAAQDYAVEPPNLSQVDEIGDMAQAIAVFRETGLERQRLEAERAADQAMRDLVARMTQRLQGCDTVGDLALVVRTFAAEIAPAFAGRFYIADEHRQLMREAASWGEPHHSAPEFPVGDCWALRRGQLHRPAGERIDIRCPHACESETDDLCVPVTVRGETIGLIYFERQSALARNPADLVVYLELLAENIGLALANLRLRDALRAMALLDPLTGLSNRRRLDVALQAQLREAEKSGRPLACLMLDLDHFKRINDSYGHEAGDAVLRSVGEVLGHAVRGEGMAFRHGGEEFLLLMPGISAKAAAERAEQIRERIEALQIRQDGSDIGPVTCSIGIAAFPDHGTGDSLVHTADAALLRAKKQGRDRIVVATVRTRKAIAA